MSRRATSPIPSFINLILAAALASTTTLVNAFSFNTSTPTQCGQMTVQWDGGVAPFQLSLVPTISVSGGRILNITIPSGLTQPYSYTFDLNEPAGLQFLASMSDSTGFGTGGTTSVLTVGSSSNSSCIDSNLQYDFYFEVSTNSPTQCNTLTVTWPNNVTAPVNLYGLIPSGTAFQLPISQNPSTSSSYDWPVDIAQGTQFLLYMSDAGAAQTGGSTSLLTVGQGSTGCMNSTSPRTGGITTSSSSSTATSSSASASASVSGVGGSSGGGTANDSNGSGSGSSGGSSKTGAIVGGAVGGVAFLVLLAALLFFCLRRRARERRGSGGSPILKNYGAPPPSEKSGRFDILGLGGRSGTEKRRDKARRWADQETRVGEEAYEPSPFTYPSPPTSTVQNGHGHGGAATLAGLAGAGAGAGGALGAGRKEREVAEDRHRSRASGGMETDGSGTPTRPSYDSTLTPTRSVDQTHSGTNTNSVPRTPTGQGQNFPPSAAYFGKQSSPLVANQNQIQSQNQNQIFSERDGSQADRTDMATLGHERGDDDIPIGAGAGATALGRGNSTRKTGLGLGGMTGSPTSPTQYQGRRGVDEGVVGDSHGDHGGAGAGAILGAQVGSGGRDDHERETRFVQHEDVGPVVDLPPRYDQLRARNPDGVQA